MNNLPEFAYLENTLDNSKASYYFSHPKAEVLCTHPDTLNAQLEHLWSLQQQAREGSSNTAAERTRLTC